MKKIKDIIVLVLIAIPLFLFLILNHILLVLGDLFGISAWRARSKIRREFEPAIRQFEQNELDRRKTAILTSFEAQGYANDETVELIESNGVFAVRISHKTAKNTKTGLPKLAYYLEGTPYEQGRFIGLLSGPDVERMSVDYVDNVIFNYAAGLNHMGFWGNILADFLYFLAKRNDAFMPRDLTAEIYGIWEGCSHQNLKKKVLIRDLYVLNYGVDILLGYVYAGVEPILKFLGIKIADFVPPVACNAFGVSGEEAQGGAFFGRDFMFPTCNVYNEVAAHMVHRPVSDGQYFEREHKNKRRFRSGHSKGKNLPHTVLSFCAPGMVGSVLALNEHGLSMGLDMLAGRNSDWKKVGLNSLCMVRYAVTWARDVDELVDVVEEAPRGITWLYPFAHGPSGRSGVIESGMKTDDQNNLRFTPKFLKKLLPSEDFLKAHQTTKWRKGIFVREANYAYDEAYLGFNKDLFNHFKLPFDQEKFGETAYMTEKPHEDALPASYYFAPQREKSDKIFVTTNMAITPEARLLAMNEWTNLVPESAQDFTDFQWRYDRLNRRVLGYAKGKGVDLEATKDCISFLRPYNADGTKAEFFFYYGIKDGKELPASEIQVGGSTSAVDLLSLYVETLYGQYSDPWVGLSLGKILKAL